MIKITTTLIACMLIMFAHAQFNSQNLKTDYSTETTSTFENLRLYAVHANDVFLALHKDIGKFTVLEDAVKDQKLVVSEVSSSGTVNTLYAENVSSDTIFIMAGEIVKGGKQDRVIAQDFIITPGQKVDVGAFCVEHGRWTADGSNIQIMNVSGDAQLEAIEVAEFSETAKVVSADVRKAAVVDKNQGKVWDEVDEVTIKNSAGSATGTYNALETSDPYQENLQKYLDKFSVLFINDSTTIGIIAVTGDRIIGCDLFATYELFASQYENLLHSYITEAITNGGKVTVESTAVETYMNEFLADESKQEEILKSSGKLFENNGRILHCTRF